MIALSVCMSWARSCTRRDVSRLTAPAADPKFMPALSDKEYVLTGTVEHMGWSKSSESWEAGGSDYYVLVCIDLPAEYRSDLGAKSGQPLRLIMRETPAFPTREKFLPFAANRVEVRGRRSGIVDFMADYRGPSDPMEQDCGPRRGDGILVDRIQKLDVAQSAPRR